MILAAGLMMTVTGCTPDGTTRLTRYRPENERSGVYERIAFPAAVVAAVVVVYFRGRSGRRADASVDLGHS